MSSFILEEVNSEEAIKNEENPVVRLNSRIKSVFIGLIDPDEEDYLEGAERKEKSPYQVLLN